MIQQVPANFTLDELLAYLRQEPNLEGYLTSREWAEHFGVDVDKMRELLGEAKRAGRLLCSRASRERLDGRQTTLPVYAFDLSRDGDAQDEAVSV